MKRLLRWVKGVLSSNYFSAESVYVSKDDVDFSRVYFSGYNRICERVRISDSDIGLCSYIGPGVKLKNSSVGRFTSIGPECVVISGVHPFDWVSMHPAFYSLRKQCGLTFVETQKFDEFKRIKKEGRAYSVLIGSDVWVGYGAKFIEGVSVGDGAVVLAGAVVTSDVEPYSIVGGVPAKHLRFRFDEEVREELLRTKWWNKDLNWIRSNSHCFDSVDDFLSENKE